MVFLSWFFFLFSGKERRTPFPFPLYYANIPVSRVLCYAIIYLESALPQISSCLCTPDGRPMGSHHGIAPNKVYTADGVTIVPVSSYLAFSPLPCGGFFLLHYLGSHLRRTLSVILSRRSPDFPQTSPFV